MTQNPKFEWVNLARWAPLFLVGAVVIALLMGQRQTATQAAHMGSVEHVADQEGVPRLGASLEDYYNTIEQSGMDDQIKLWAWDRVREAFDDPSVQGRTTLRMVDALLRIPFNIYREPGVSLRQGPEYVQLYMKSVRRKLDEAVYGQAASKDELMRLVAQWLSNPESRGTVLGLEGPPGIGKTRLIREGVGEALNRPVVAINLGGAKHAELLVGSERVYIGSRWGQIAEGLIQHGCMNPIFYFDEIDKVAHTEHGREIIDTLMHLIDPSQNNKFQDRYFAEVELDLSRSLFIFSFNDRRMIDPILLDRIKVIELEGYSTEDKLEITRKFLWPEALTEVGLSSKEVVLSDAMIRWLTESFTFEAGVRHLKEHLQTVAMQVNLLRMTDKNFKLPKAIDEAFVRETLIEDEIELDKVDGDPEVGAVNGLFATSYGIGGILKYHVVPTSPLSGSLVITGNLGEMAYESAVVAHTVAWKLLPEKTRQQLESQGERAWHVHRAGVGTLVEGPSAGSAVTMAFYSAFTNRQVRNDVALTGEVDLRGRVLPIGGLSAKLRGAKKAGVKTVLVPKGNEKELKDIQETLPELFDDSFTVIVVETMEQVLQHGLV